MNFGKMAIATTLLVTTACRPTDKPKGEPTAPSVSAKVVAVARRDIPMTVEVPVSLESYYRTGLASRITAHVQDIRADIGDTVHRGDVLVQLQADELLQRLAQSVERISAAEQAVNELKAGLEAWQAQIQEAEARKAAAAALVAQRKSELERMQQLVAFGSVKQSRQDEAQFALQSAEAALTQAAAGVDAMAAQRRELMEKLKSAQSMVAVRHAEHAEAQAMVDYLQIKAPFDGVITTRETDPGTVVRPPSDGGDPLMVVEQVDPMRVVCFLPMRDAQELDVGDTLKIQSLARGNQPVEPLTILRTAQAFQSQSRMMRAEAELKNPATNGQRRFRPGDYGKAELTLKVYRDATAVPLTAVVDNDGAEFVMVVKVDKVCRRVAVAVLYRTDDLAVIKPLQMEFENGDFVIVDQPGQFHDGQKLDALQKVE